MPTPAQRFVNAIAKAQNGWPSTWTERVAEAIVISFRTRA